MPETQDLSLSAQFTKWISGIRDQWRVLVHRGPSQFRFWVIALVIGISAGFAALLFRKGISALQAWVYGCWNNSGPVYAGRAGALGGRCD